ncbi:histidine phosphatase family protein [Nocardia sp. NBC_00511]|uniref:histidine phosphatase family protein n=1 Tax=Nocardia sp. NBC_00511 TaxID=2903591 RepID=UPI0030E5E6F7
MGITGAGLESLTVVRHGQSTVNAVRATGADEYCTGIRDADVPLSELGREQAVAAGKPLAAYDFDLVLCSPYRRALDTARWALGDPATVGGPEFVVDERLRDRENGILFGLTASGIRSRYPAEYRARQQLGGYYYRPPGGESWPDVALRLRGVLGELDGRVLVFAHDITVVLIRALLGPKSGLEIAETATAQVSNASINHWERDKSGMRLVLLDDTRHLVSGLQ